MSIYRIASKIAMYRFNFRRDELVAFLHPDVGARITYRFFGLDVPHGFGLRFGKRKWLVPCLDIISVISVQYQ
ncbi:MAG: hypothetical protein OXC62_15240 [Aestuariivita sp.]|nr:hypothetical protein [Aestuariivita sp.]